MRSRILILVIVSMLSSLFTSQADTIVHRGREHTDVVVEELSNQYAVYFPETGRTKYFRKEEVTRVEFSAENRSDENADSPADLPESESNASQGAGYVPEVTSQDALEQYKRRMHIRSQVQFDAAFEHWRQLEEEQRAALLASAAAQATAATMEREHTRLRVAGTRQQIDHESYRIRGNIDRSALSRDRAINSAYSKASGDFDLDWNRRLRDRHAENAEIMSQFGRGLRAESHDFWTNVYGEKVNRRYTELMGQADAQAQMLDQEYRARVAEERRELRRLAAQERRFQHQSRAELRRYTQRVQRLTGTADYLAVLEEALAEGYEPTLEYRDLFSVPGRGVMQRDVQAVSPILRIDWWVDTANPLSDQLTVRVYDSESDRLIRTDTAAKLPIEHFMIIDRPGDYLIEVDAPSALTYTLEARELRDYEYVPISPRD